MSSLSKFFRGMFSSLNRDMTRSITKEIKKMDDLTMLGPRVYNYQKSQATGGISRTLSREAPHTDSKFVRVERPVTNGGLFS